MQSTTVARSVPAPILPARTLNVKEWLAETPIVGEWATEFYRTYVGITDDEELRQHLMDVRRQAWEVYHYRCIGSFYFVNYNLAEVYGREWYSTVLERVKRGDTILDLGCAFGHAARNLVYDGAPDSNVISGDLRQEFWELGYQLFRDRKTFHGRFIQGDIFDPEYLAEYDGKIDIVHTSAFFHLFDLPSQQKIVERLLKLVSSKPGTTIFGRQVGNTVPRHYQHPTRGGLLYQHNEESFKAMFEDVAPNEWDIQVWLTEFKQPRPDTDEALHGKIGRLHFIITKL
jgi:SAM-dependent methyltransferase